MRQRLLLLLLFGCSTVFAQNNNIKAVDGICVFTTLSPALFKFVKTNEWEVSANQFIDILDYKVGSYLAVPYRGFINNELFVDGYLDTLSYGYNRKDDKRTTKIYYCNCKLLFSDSTYNEKELDIDLRYDKKRYQNKEYNYLYKGRPVRFTTRSLLSPSVDSIILFPKLD